jgi:hypothetical protein
MLALSARRTRLMRSFVTFLALGAIGVLTPEPAQAHFVLDAPVSWMSQDPSSGTPEKMAPCGNEGGGTASGMVTAFQSGQTITVTVTEVVAHAGWYRVSLVPGKSSTQTVTSLPDPTTPASSCAATIETSPAPPVLADGVLQHQMAFTTPQSVQVKLPTNMTCTSASPCTLQVVEVMNDGGHFPPGCFYHHCADITIDGGDAGAPNAADSGTASSGSGSSGSSGSRTSSGSSSSGGSSGTGTTSSGGAGGSSSGGSPSDTDASSGGAPSSGGGGCLISAGGGTPAAAALAGLFAIAAMARRRRRR